LSLEQRIKDVLSPTKWWVTGTIAASVDCSILEAHHALIALEHKQVAVGQRTDTGHMEWKLR